MKNFVNAGLVSLSLLLHAFSYAQTSNDQILERGIRLYNSVEKEFNNLTASDNISEQKEKFYFDTFSRIIVILDSVSNPENTDQQTVKEYFKLVAGYNRAYVYALTSNAQKYVDLAIPLKARFESFNENNFPARYFYDGLTYIIKQENFRYFKSRYFLILSEMSNILKNQPDRRLYALKGIECNRTASGFDYHLLMAHAMNADLLLVQNNKEAFEFATNLIINYSTLNAEHKDLLNKNNYATPDACYQVMRKFAGEDKALYDNGKPFAKVAPVLNQINEIELAKDAYYQAIKGGYNDKTFLTEAATFGVINDRNLALQSLDLLTELSSSGDCEKFDWISSKYSEIGENNKASLTAKKAAQCRDNIVRAEKKANRNFHLFLGTYPARYMTQPSKMDYGAVLGILAGKTMINFSAIKVQQKNYYFSDLWLREKESTLEGYKATWDGYQFDLGFRFSAERFRPKGTYRYIGPQIGYAKKTLATMESDVTDQQGNMVHQSFKPIDEQLQLMITTGMISYNKVAAIDLSFSLGAYYGTFSTGHDTYNLDDYTYSNILLDNELNKHWGPIMRINLVVGLML